MASGWEAEQRRVAAQLSPVVCDLLADLAGAVGGLGRGSAWEIVTVSDQAAWRLYRLVDPSGRAGMNYQELGVRAIISPSGSLVALQLDNGDDFLALSDTSAASLRRGLSHLLQQGLPVRESRTAPFERRSPTPLARLRTILQR